MPALRGEGARRRWNEEVPNRAVTRRVETQPGQPWRSRSEKMIRVVMALLMVR